MEWIHTKLKTFLCPVWFFPGGEMVNMCVRASLTTVKIYVFLHGWKIMAVHSTSTSSTSRECMWERWTTTKNWWSNEKCMRWTKKLKSKSSKEILFFVCLATGISSLWMRKINENMIIMISYTRHPVQFTHEFIQLNCTEICVRILWWMSGAILRD